MRKGDTTGTRGGRGKSTLEGSKTGKSREAVLRPQNAVDSVIWELK